MSMQVVQMILILNND